MPARSRVYNGDRRCMQIFEIKLHGGMSSLLVHVPRPDPLSRIAKHLPDSKFLLDEIDDLIVASFRVKLCNFSRTCVDYNEVFVSTTMSDFLLHWIKYCRRLATKFYVCGIFYWKNKQKWRQTCSHLLSDWLSAQYRSMSFCWSYSMHSCAS